VRLPRDIIELGRLNFTHVVVHRYNRLLDLDTWPVDIPENLREPSDAHSAHLDHRFRPIVTARFAPS
jgi:hypothetical protein